MDGVDGPVPIEKSFRRFTLIVEVLNYWTMTATILKDLKRNSPQCNAIIMQSMDFRWCGKPISLPRKVIKYAKMQMSR